jgi:hypothetical protein
MYIAAPVNKTHDTSRRDQSHKWDIQGAFGKNDRFEPSGQTAENRVRKSNFDRSPNTDHSILNSMGINKLSRRCSVED